MTKFIKTTVREVSDNFDNLRIPLSSKQRENLEKIYPYYGAQNIIDYVDNYLFDGEYVLIAEDGENLRSQSSNVCNLVKGKFWVNNHAHILKGKNGNSSKYLCYYLNQLNFSPFVTGSAQPKLTKDNLGSIPLEIPAIKVQKQIAKVLSDLDAKIEVNNKINQELEAMAKTIYDYWFVQFDFPFDFLPDGEAGAHGKPNLNGKPYKSSGGKMVYNEELKREIPEGWEVSTISDWIGNDKNGDWGKADEQGNYTEKVSCIRGADINGLNGNGEVKSPTRFILAKNTHKLLEVGDLIIEISGGSPTQSTGRLGFITQETLDRFENPLICSNFCRAVTLKDDTYLYNFVYLWNRLYDAGVLFGWEGKTSGIKNLLFENFITNYQVVKPPRDLVELFHEKVSVIHQKKQKNLLENQKLAELRDWLLPMLMNGQVRVAHPDDNQDMDKLGMVAEDTSSFKNN